MWPRRPPIQGFLLWFQCFHDTVSWMRRVHWWAKESKRDRERESTYIFTRIRLKENLFANPQLLPPARKTMTFQQEEGPRGFQARRKKLFWAMCLCCLSQYICWRNCKLTFYYSSFHGRHWVQDACSFLCYYLNLLENQLSFILFRPAWHVFVFSLLGGHIRSYNPVWMRQSWNVHLFEHLK